jgi:hypothetical protein
VEVPTADDNPTLKRSSGLEFGKKAVSFFMPNKNTPWNIESETGNPTMSVAVNELIKRVKKCEVRKRGKKSNAKRDLQRAEFRKTLRLLEGHGDFHRRHKVTAMMKVQFHIIGRADDICNIETGDMREHAQKEFASFALQTKVSWSKNVMEERDCPDQILLGANDADFCVLLGMACYLECRFSPTGPHQPNGIGSRFLFGESNADDEPIRANDRYRRTLDTTWKDDGFKTLMGQVRGSIGSHSLRKFPSTWASQHGISQDDIEVRGRWKGGKNGRTVNRYISVEQLPTDGRVAGILAVGGPVKYKLKADSHVTDAWLLDNVVPGLKAHFAHDPNNKLPLVLSLSVLWVAHTAGLEHMLTDEVRLRVKDAYALIRGDNPADWNPVVKAPLCVTRVENKLVIDELLAVAPDQPGADGAPLQQAQALHGHREQLQAVLNQIHQLRQQQSESQMSLAESIVQLQAFCAHRFSRLTLNMNRMRAAAPFAGAANGGVGGIPAGDGGLAAPPAARNATLSPGPKTVHDLWVEYQHGIGGRVPAKDFRGPERGRCRSTYCKRNRVWAIIKRLVDAGIDADVACDRFYQAYGANKSVTFILDTIAADKTAGRGIHPNLRV